MYPPEAMSWTAILRDDVNYSITQGMRFCEDCQTNQPVKNFGARIKMPPDGMVTLLRACRSCNEKAVAEMASRFRKAKQ